MGFVFTTRDPFEMQGPYEYGGIPMVLQDLVRMERNAPYSMLNDKEPSGNISEDENPTAISRGDP